MALLSNFFGDNYLCIDILGESRCEKGASGGVVYLLQYLHRSKVILERYFYMYK